MFNEVLVYNSHFFEIFQIFFNLSMSYSSLEMFIKCLIDFNTACGVERGREVWDFLLKKSNNLNPLI